MDVGGVRRWRGAYGLVVEFVDEGGGGREDGGGGCCGCGGRGWGVGGNGCCIVVGPFTLLAPDPTGTLFAPVPTPPPPPVPFRLLVIPFATLSTSSLPTPPPSPLSSTIPPTNGLGLSFVGVGVVLALLNGLEGIAGESVTGGGFFPAATIGTGRLAAVSTGGLRFELEVEVEMGSMLGPEDTGLTGIAGIGTADTGGGTGMVGVEDDTVVGVGVAVVGV